MDYNLKSIREDFKNKGIFYTPPELAEMIKSYINFKPIKVYDPTCGDGGLLAVFDDGVKKYGQEINKEQLEVANQRLLNFDGYCGDTLKDPYFLDEKFDCIVANPPFSINWEPIVDIRFEKVPAIPTKGKADYAFILHILHYLSDDGVAVILGFPGVLYRGNKEGEIRKWLVTQNYIDRIVEIPGDTFVDTKISTIIIVLKKNKTTTDIIFESKKLKLEKVVSFNEIKSNDFNLSVSTYIQEEKIEVIINPKELQSTARKQMIEKLRNDIQIDLAVCELEKVDNKEYLYELLNIINEFIRR